MCCRFGRTNCDGMRKNTKKKKWVPSAIFTGAPGFTYTDLATEQLLSSRSGEGSRVKAGRRAAEGTLYVVWRSATCVVVVVAAVPAVDLTPDARANIPHGGAKELYTHSYSTHSTEKQMHCVTTTFAVSMDDGQITHLPSDRLLWILFIKNFPPMSIFVFL